MSDNNKEKTCKQWWHENLFRVARLVIAGAIAVFGLLLLWTPIAQALSGNSLKIICEQVKETTSSLQIHQMGDEKTPDSVTTNLPSATHAVQEPKATAADQITEISQAPRVWALFLLLSATVGALWAVLWAVVSLCRID